MAPVPAPSLPPLAQCPPNGASGPISCWMSNFTADGGVEVVNTPMGDAPGAVCFNIGGTCTDTIATMGIPGCDNSTIGKQFTAYAGAPGPSAQSNAECTSIMSVFPELGFTTGTACASNECNAPPGAEQQQQQAVQAQQQTQQNAGQQLQNAAAAQAAALCPTAGSKNAVSCYTTVEDNSTGTFDVELIQYPAGSICMSYIGPCTQDILPVGLPGCLDNSDVGANFSMYGVENGPSNAAVQQCNSDMSGLLSSGLFTARARAAAPGCRESVCTGRAEATGRA